MIRVYLDKLMYSPFDFPDFDAAFAKSNITITKSASNAHIIMSSYQNILEKYVSEWGSKKKYLLWTHEPYHNWSYDKKISSNSKPTNPIHIMNCYTSDVFTHNHRYFYFRNKIETPVILPTLTLTPPTGLQPTATPTNQRLVVALSTLYEPSYYKDNKYSTLPIRYKVIEEGVRREMVDVHGKGWDKHKFVRSVGNSRNDNDRRDSKLDILKGYKFNICLENVDFGHYVTEKIWESIKGGCVPIYYSNSTIYESLPQNSFIDVREYEIKYGDLEEGIKQMYGDLATMTEAEYQRRYQECVKGFNKIIEDGKNNMVRLHSKNLNINYVEYKTCCNALIKKLTNL